MEQKSKPWIVGALLVAFLVLAFIMLTPYINALFFAGALVIVFWPMYKALARFMRSSGWAAFVSLLFVVAIIVVPIFLFGFIAFNEARGLYVSFLSGKNIDWFISLTQSFENFVDTMLPGVGVSFDVQGAIVEGLDWVLRNLGALFSGVAGVFITFLFALFILFFLFKDGERFRQFLYRITPLDETNSSLIFEKIRLSVNAVVRGSLVIAIVQGIMSGIGFIILGIPNAVLLSGVATIASLIPGIGPALMFIPVVVYGLVSKSLWYAGFAALWGFGVVGLVDNVLRPYLVQRSTNLHQAVIFLSVFGGLWMFGPIGFIVGPVVFSILFALLDIYSSFTKGSHDGTLPKQRPKVVDIRARKQKRN